MFDETVSWGKKAEQKSAKHPDTKSNIDYGREFLARGYIREKLSDAKIKVTYGGLNPNSLGGFEELTYMQLYWTAHGRPYGFSLGFSMDHAEFMQKLNRFFGINLTQKELPRRLVENKAIA